MRSEELKRGKRSPVLLLCLGLALLMAGCATNRVAMDLVEYVNQGILNISELEIKALKIYASVTGKNYTTDEKVYESLNKDIIPIYGRFLDLLRNIDPKEDDVRQLHSIYIHGTETIYSGFKIKMLGLEKNNEHLILTGNNKIEKGRIETEKWLEELMTLYKKYGVSQKNDKTDNKLQKKKGKNDDK